ncbi:hypothetical protein JCM8547_004736 [Rhodosporidiobolus lusitaniae]
MVNLDSLPALILDLLAKDLSPSVQPSPVEWLRKEPKYEPPHRDLVALSTVSKTLRRALLPTVFAYIEFGLGGPSRAEIFKHKSPVQKSLEVLAVVKHVIIVFLHSSTIGRVNKALELMTNVETVEYGGMLPFHLAFVETLKRSTSFHRLYFVMMGCGETGGTSLGALSSTGSPRKWLQQLFDVMVDEASRSYPTFPKLERLSLKHVEGCLGLKHLLKTSGPYLTHLDLGMYLNPRPLPPLREPFKNLETLIYVCGDNVTCEAFIRKSLQDVPLRHLVLNGLVPSETPAVFECIFGRCLVELRIVTFRDASPELMVSHLEAIVSACPELRTLMIKAAWGEEGDGFLQALKPLTKLRSFNFDHLFIQYDFASFLASGARRIRRESAGDFRILTVPAGQTVDQVVRRMIQDDLDAVKPTYVSHFTPLARDIPTLEEIVWHATSEVKWTWTFWREQVEDSKGRRSRIRFKQDPTIKIEESGGGVLSTTKAVVVRRTVGRKGA